jgi:hypothetical protein
LSVSSTNKTDSHDIAEVSLPCVLLIHGQVKIKTGVACGAGTAYPSGAPEFTTGF